jgi:hypothetical protein
MCRHTFTLPSVITDLWKSHQELVTHYKSTPLKFTLDGRLVGDIAEAIAVEKFRLVFPKKRTPGVDALTEQNETVQIKATGSRTKGPAFSPGAGKARYLLFLQLDFEAGEAVVIYNGLEEPVRKLLPNTWKGTKVVSLRRLEELASASNLGLTLPLFDQQS